MTGGRRNCLKWESTQGFLETARKPRRLEQSKQEKGEPKGAREGLAFLPPGVVASDSRSRDVPGSGIV